MIYIYISIDICTHMCLCWFRLPIAFPSFLLFRIFSEPRLALGIWHHHISDLVRRMTKEVYPQVGNRRLVRLMRPEPRNNSQNVVGGS